MKNKERMRYRSSFETTREIMKVLALEKEFAQYDLPRRIGKNYRTVLRHLKDLQNTGLVRVSRTEKSMKRGKDRNIFTLTETGLLYALGYSDIWQDVGKVASNYSDLLPLIFGKWDFYIQKGLQKEIITRLRAAVEGFMMQLGREWYRIIRANSDQKTKTKLEKLKGKEIAETIMARHRTIAPTLTHRVLGLAPYLYLGKDTEAVREQQKFIQTLIEDAELRQYCDEEFDYWVKRAKLEYDRYAQALKWYKDLKAHTHTRG